MINPMIHEHKIYTVNGTRMRCLRVRESGICTFEKIDQDGNRIKKERGTGMDTFMDCGLELVDTRKARILPELPRKTIYDMERERFNDLYCDGTGNCYSDADPGL